MKPTVYDTSNVLPFRPRHKAVPRLRPPLLRRLLKPLFQALLIVGLPTVMPLLLLRWLETSPRLALQDLRIDLTAPTAHRGAPSGRLTDTAIRQAMRPFLGQNLWRMQLAQVAAHLEQHPWIATLDLRKDLPHRLILRVSERQAVALLREQQQLYYLDAEGAVIARFEPEDSPADFLLISRSNPKVTDLKPALELEGAFAAQ